MDVTDTNLVEYLSRDAVLALAECQSAPCVSLFVPVAHGAPSAHQNELRFEHLLQGAEAQLVAGGLSPAAAQRLLAPAAALCAEAPLWTHQTNTLAVFVAPELFRSYQLPLSCEELVIVDSQAHITPLLPLLHDDTWFYLLTLGLAGVQLFRGTRSSLLPIALQGAPAGLSAALANDEFSKEAQWHPGVPGYSGERGAIFHGQGARDGTIVKQEILRYFQQVNQAVRHAVGETHVPLILAGLSYLLPLYRATNTAPQLVAQAITLNPTAVSPEELHHHAWAMAASLADRACAAAVEHYELMRGVKPALATGYLRAIIPAAVHGRIDTLFIAMGERRWGVFEPVRGELVVHAEAHPGDTELLNLAVVQTIRHGGAVFPITQAQLPDAAPLAAVLRYT